MILLSVEKLLKNCKDLFKSENYEDSLCYCNQVLDLDSKNETALDYKSMALFYLERYNESLNCLNFALEIYPNNGSMWNTKAAIMFNFEKYEDAIQCFDSSLDCVNLNKKDEKVILKNKSMCHLGIAGDLFYEKFEFEEALENLKIYLEYFPEDNDALEFKDEILTSIENKENPYIDVEKRDGDGNLIFKKKVGSPDIVRKGVYSYKIERIVCDKSEKSFIFVVEKMMEDDSGINVRYMVEAAKF